MALIDAAHHINTQWQSTILHEYKHFRVYRWKMLTTLVCAPKSRVPKIEGTLYNHFELFCAIMARFIVSNVRMLRTMNEYQSIFNVFSFGGCYFSRILYQGERVSLSVCVCVTEDRCGSGRFGVGRCLSLIFTYFMFDYHWSDTFTRIRTFQHSSISIKQVSGE